MTDITENESRMTAYTRIESKLNQIAANQERLEKHMVTLAKVNEATRQMSEEDRAATDARFPEVVCRNRFLAPGGCPAGAALATGDIDTGHKGAGFARFVSGYIKQSFQ